MWMVLTWQFASAGCGGLINAAVEQLPAILEQRQVTDLYLDLDETIVLPDTPFIFGMPGTNGFIAHLDPCLSAAAATLTTRMEETYYEAPMQLVDPRLPQIIAEVKHQMRVFALTSRHTGAASVWEAHNFQMIEFLAAAGIQFFVLPRGVAGNETAVGGIIFAQGEKVNKGSIIKDMLRSPGQKAALVDNTLSKLESAMAVPDLCLVGNHFTAAHDLEQSDTARLRWMCKELIAMGGGCDSCGLEL